MSIPGIDNMRINEFSKNKSKLFREVQANKILEDCKCVFTIVYMDENRKKLISVDVWEHCKIKNDVLKQKVARFLPRSIRESWKFASVSRKPIWQK
jgi:hypothetical protein